MNVVNGRRGLERQHWVYGVAYSYRDANEQNKVKIVSTDPYLITGNIQPDRKRKEWELNTEDFVKKYDFLKFYTKDRLIKLSEEEILELIPVGEDPKDIGEDFVFFFYRGFVYLIDSDGNNLFNTRGVKHQVFYTRGVPLEDFDAPEVIEGWGLEEYPYLYSLDEFETAVRRLGVTVNQL